METNIYPKKCACCKTGIIEDKCGICSICGWEDDKVQNCDENYAGGANHDSLSVYRRKFHSKELDWISHINIDVLQNTGLVRAFYTTIDNSAWKYGKEGAYQNCINLSKTLNIDTEQMIMLNQTHTNGVRVVSEKEAGEMVTKPISEDGNDGMITNTPGLLLCTVEADCVPVYLLDPIKKAIGMVHSGWRGTSKSISGNAIDKMIANYESNPKDIIVVIGPCICKDCYEVGGEIIDEFREVFSMDEINEFFIPRKDQKYSLDLRKAITIDLINKGININNIHDTGVCTYENENLCSWRRDNPIMRSMLTAIMLV